MMGYGFIRWQISQISIMRTFSIRYSFAQRFRVKASDAYNWCTDYDSKDIGLMGMDGKRNVLRISKDTIILTDTYYKGRERISKKKLVRLNPERFSWTNTHLAGPIKYSQFLYEIVPEGKNSSRLEFTGLQIEYKEKIISQRKVATLASKLKREDSHSWKLLARAMEKDLIK